MSWSYNLWIRSNRALHLHVSFDDIDKRNTTFCSLYICISNHLKLQSQLYRLWNWLSWSGWRTFSKCECYSTEHTAIRKHALDKITTPSGNLRSQIMHYYFVERRLYKIDISSWYVPKYVRLNSDIPEELLNQPEVNTTFIAFCFSIFPNALRSFFYKSFFLPATLKFSSKTFFFDCSHTSTGSIFGALTFKYRIVKAKMNDCLVRPLKLINILMSMLMSWFRLVDE